MVAPVGVVTVNGISVTILLSHGASLTRKLLDAPESKIAHANRFLSVRVIVGSRDSAANEKPFLLEAEGCWGARTLGVGVEVGCGHETKGSLFSLSHISPYFAPNPHMYPFPYPCC